MRGRNVYVDLSSAWGERIISLMGLLLIVVLLGIVHLVGIIGVRVVVVVVIGHSWIALEGWLISTWTMGWIFRRTVSVLSGVSLAGDSSFAGGEGKVLEEVKDQYL